MKLAINALTDYRIEHCCERWIEMKYKLLALKIFLVVLTLFTCYPTQAYAEDYPSVQVRNIFESMGYGVRWDGTTKTIILTRENQTIQLKLNSNVAIKNGKQVTLTHPIINKPKVYRTVIGTQDIYELAQTPPKKKDVTLYKLETHCG